MTYILIILYAFQLNVFAQDSLRKSYPNSLLTEDYGILTEADLLYDIKKNGNQRSTTLVKCNRGIIVGSAFQLML